MTDLIDKIENDINRKSSPCYIAGYQSKNRNISF